MHAKSTYTSKSTRRAMGRTTGLKKNLVALEDAVFVLCLLLCSVSWSELFWMRSVCMVSSILFRRVLKVSDISVVYFSHSLRDLHFNVTYPCCCANFEMFLKNSRTRFCCVVDTEMLTVFVKFT